VKLRAGTIPLRLTYTRRPGPVAFAPRWRSEHFAWEPLPGAALSHERGLTADVPDAAIERGRRVVEEHGCVGCHATASPSLTKRFGPRLDGVGARATATWIARWLEEPGAFRAGAIMPALLDRDERRDVTAYLTTLTTRRPGPAQGPALPPVKVGPHHAVVGNDLYQSIGCASCHQQKALTLAGLGSKWTSVDGLADYLLDPAAVHPGGRMPSSLLTRAEAVSRAPPRVIHVAAASSCSGAGASAATRWLIRRPYPTWPGRPRGRGCARTKAASPRSRPPSPGCRGFASAPSSARTRRPSSRASASARIGA
jgi:cytochrome c2